MRSRKRAPTCRQSSDATFSSGRRCRCEQVNHVARGSFLAETLLSEERALLPFLGLAFVVASFLGVALAATPLILLAFPISVGRIGFRALGLALAGPFLLKFSPPQLLVVRERAVSALPAAAVVSEVPAALFLPRIPCSRPDIGESWFRL